MERTLVALALAVTLVLAPNVAFADAARAQSRAFFVDGVAALEDTRPGDALTLFEKAYELYPHYGTLLNIGICHRALGRPADAANAFQRFLDDGGGEIPADERTRVTTLLGEMDARTTVVTLRLTPVASATLDGHPLKVGAPLRVAPGPHVIEARAEGYEPSSVKFSGAPGEAKSFDLALVPTAAPVPVSEAPEPPRSARFNTAFFVTAGVSAVAFGTAIATGAMALSNHSAYDDPTTSDAVASEKRSAGKTLGVVADVALCVGIVGALTATIVALRPLPKAAASRSISRGLARVSPFVSVSGAGAAMDLTF